MQQVSSKKIILLGLLLSGFLWANMAKAICPVCVVAIGAGLGLSRWLGVDDVVSSVWIGALLVSIILWTLIEMEKKKWRFAYDAVIISLAYYLLTFIPLYYSGIVGHPLNKFLGTDKVIFGTFVGSIVFLLSHWLNLYLKKKNNGKVFFPYQKVVLPVVVLILTSSIFYIIIKWWTI
ncbi:MAG: hypothetical protein ABSF55_02135 [Candidatus Staskawiczbacteria bacterium]|jgi:hypothetical protein